MEKERKINIVIFSSGESERSGLLNKIINNLNTKGYNCFCWKDLFFNAHNKDSIALLPILIKKIPTFDFALLVCEGHDETVMKRNGKLEKVNTMRDNVLFEIGLSTMALGLSRVILVTDSNVHIPDDLKGLNGQVALKHFIYNNNSKEVTDLIDEHIKINKENYFNKVINGIDDYVSKNKKYISPVVIGAATSIAEGYATNFIIRLLESFEKGFYTDDEIYKYNLEDIQMKIIIPTQFKEDTLSNIANENANLKKGILKEARLRELYFNYELKDKILYIVDYPTTLVTSYNTAKLILNIESDEENDDLAKERFYAKELDLFEVTLKNILKKDFVSEVIKNNYSNLSNSKQEKLINKITNFILNNIKIERADYL